jgi:hypothetical protein
LQIIISKKIDNSFFLFFFLPSFFFSFLFFSSSLFLSLSFPVQSAQCASTDTGALCGLNFTGVFTGFWCDHRNFKSGVEAHLQAPVQTALICDPVSHGLAQLLQIKVRLPNERVVTGWLDNSDSDYNLVVVNIKSACDFQAINLSSNHPVQFDSNHKVVDAGSYFDSGLLKFSNGIVMSSPTNEDSDHIFSACKIDMVSRVFLLEQIS